MSRQKLAALILSSILKYLSLSNTDADAEMQIHKQLMQKKKI